MKLPHIGIAEVQRRLKENGNPQAKFDISLVTAFRVGVGQRIVESENSGKETSVESTEKSTDESIEDATETEKKIIALMREDKSITQKAMAKKLGITRNYVAKMTMALTARHLIRRVGSDRGGYWRVLI